MKRKLILLTILNTFDAIATYLFWIKYHTGEQNPLMRFILEISPVLFLVVKLIFSILLLTTININLKSKVINTMLVSVLILYSGICILHLLNLGAYLLWN